MALAWLLALAAATQDSTAAFWQRLEALDNAETVQAVTAQQPAGSVEHSLGLVRAYQLTRFERDGAAAERRLREQLEQQKADVWLQFGLGEVLAIKSPRKFPLRASRHLLEALRLDSMHVPAAAALARLAVASREKELLIAARRAAERITRVTPHAGLFQALADIAREQRDEAAHKASSEAALAADPRSASARYQVALMQLAEARTVRQGYENYLAAAELRDPAVLAQIKRELSYLGHRGEWPSFEAGRSPRSQLEAFWNNRAIRDGRTPEQRVAEHYRRLAHARDKFHAKWSATYGEQALDWNAEGEPPGFDDRGRVYIRYGEPSEILRGGTGGLQTTRPDGRPIDPVKGPIMSNATVQQTGAVETWVYHLPQRDRIIFHFQLQMTAGRGYILSRLPGCGSWLGPTAHLSGEYLLLATKCSSGSAPEWSVRTTLRNLDQWYTEQAEQALKSDAHVSKYRRELAAAAELLSFRGENGEREFALVLAAASDRYNVNLVVADTTRDYVQRFDAVVNTPQRTAQQLATIVHHFSIPELHAPFFRAHLSEASDEAIGQSFGANVPMYLMKGFDISDVVLADTAPGGSLRRGAVRLRPIPALLNAGRAFQAYYEIYGLPAGADYETTLAFEPIEGGVAAALRRLRGVDAVRIRFRGTITSTSWRQQELRSVQAALAPGAYRLTITVRDPRNGAEAARQRLIRVT